MRVGFLGPNGSFSHHVALQAFPLSDLLACETITDVMKAYQKKQVDYAIVPIENSIEGSVHETLDYLFHQADIVTVAEVVLPIKQQLLATSREKQITKIFSHPQALAQGKKYITCHYPKAELELTASTSYAARYISDHPKEPFAAIAPIASAKEYGLLVLAKDIQESEDNVTRFWILGEKRPSLSLSCITEKLTLALTLPRNLPGALYKALSVFAWREIDLTKIESRPLKTALGEYFFIVDIDKTQEALLSYALEELRSMKISYKILGSYPVFTAS